MSYALPGMFPTWEAELGGLPYIQGQPVLHIKTLCQKQKQKLKAEQKPIKLNFILKCYMFR